jgi:hypothetical protein
MGTELYGLEIDSLTRRSMGVGCDMDLKITTTTHNTFLMRGIDGAGLRLCRGPALCIAAQCPEWRYSAFAEGRAEAMKV